MAEYIEREALINFANNHKGSTIDANDIARFPTADVVEVVRCKDCKYHHWEQEPCHGAKMDGKGEG